MKSIAVTLLVVFCVNAFAQDWAKTPTRDASDVALQVGDRIPFEEFHNMVNYPKKSLVLTDRKAKLTLLDFWATTCGPCIKFWPTAMKLQEEFKGDLQIVLVNSFEGTKTVKKFLERRRQIDGFEMNLPTSCRDSTTWKYFPGSSLPRYVWIDANGVVGAITDGMDVTRDNIKRWITTGPFKMANLQRKKYFDVYPTKPIFVNGNGGERPDDVFIWSSSLTRGQNDIPAGASIDYDSLFAGISVTSSPIITLLGRAYNNRLREFDIFDFLPLSRMQLIAKDTLRYWGDGTLGGNTFNYQLIAGETRTREQLLKMMQEDLYRYFNLEVKWEKQRKKCLVFTMFDSTLATKSKIVAPELKMRDGDIILDSVTVKDITTLMEMGTGYYRSARYPLVDETGYEGVITGIRERSHVIDPVTLDRILMKHGLRLKFEIREVDILVLKER